VYGPPFRLVEVLGIGLFCDVGFGASHDPSPTELSRLVVGESPGKSEEL
jgi:hypothetical protein